MLMRPEGDLIAMHSQYPDHIPCAILVLSLSTEQSHERIGGKAVIPAMLRTDLRRERALYLSAFLYSARRSKPDSLILQMAISWYG